MREFERERNGLMYRGSCRVAFGQYFQILGSPGQLLLVDRERVCVREMNRERERDREIQREIERKKERGR